MNVMVKVLLAGTAVASLCACATRAPENLPVAPGEKPNAETSIIPGSQADFLSQMNGRDTIYFDTDRFNVDADDVEALQAQARWLQRYPAKQARIEGHCDERGTREYNLGLGERRAKAAKNYLVSLGVDESRLKTISYGKERPAVLGSDEAAWSQNRRAVTITID